MKEIWFIESMSISENFFSNDSSIFVQSTPTFSLIITFIVFYFNIFV